MSWDELWPHSLSDARPYIPSFSQKGRTFLVQWTSESNQCLTGTAFVCDVKHPNVVCTLFLATKDWRGRISSEGCFWGLPRWCFQLSRFLVCQETYSTRPLFQWWRSGGRSKWLKVGLCQWLVSLSIICLWFSPRLWNSELWFFDDYANHFQHLKSRCCHMGLCHEGKFNTIPNKVTCTESYQDFHIQGWCHNHSRWTNVIRFGFCNNSWCPDNNAMDMWNSDWIKFNVLQILPTTFTGSVFIHPSWVQFTEDFRQQKSVMALFSCGVIHHYFKLGSSHWVVTTDPFCWAAVL